jgi:peptidoglycan hydrolase CwlO-like protein
MKREEILTRWQDPTIEKLQQENKELQQKVNQLETNIDEAIEYIKNNIQEGYSEVFDAEMRWDAVSGDDLLEILERGKE